MKREKGLLIPRIAQSIMFGLVLGSLFYQARTLTAGACFLTRICC